MEKDSIRLADAVEAADRLRREQAALPPEKPT
jgi:hypothetical protein